MQRLILGIIDIFAGILILLSFNPMFEASNFIATFAVFLIIKGAFFYLKSFIESKHVDKFHLFQLIDIIAGIVMLLSFYGFYNPIFTIMGIFMILKGGWDAISDFGG